jgi:hypothetical protein
MRLSIERVRSSLSKIKDRLSPLAKRGPLLELVVKKALAVMNSALFHSPLEDRHPSLSTLWQA